MKGICALYNVEAELRESHIYPRFVINHTKKTGGSYFRRGIDVNKREQDGIKLHLLSDRAEQEFSKREKWFAEKIFVPYLSEKNELQYDENLYYFTISFLWRILILNLKDPNISSKWYYAIIKEAEIEWRKYLSDGISPSKYFKSYLFFTSRVTENYSSLTGVDFYLTRVMDGTIVDNKTHTCLLMYGKFNRFVFWSVLKEYGDENQLSSVEINPNGGLFKIPQSLNYFPIISFLQHRIEVVANMPRPNQQQQDKIEKEIMKDPKAFWKSDLGKSLYNDKFNLDL